MKRVKEILFLIVVAFIGFADCKKPYAPSITVSNVNYLVVEGVINSGTDSTIIKLSRTVTISTKTTPNPELNAIVTVESDQNASYPIPEISNGRYGSSALNFDNTRKYRLRIKTAAGKEYLSDFEAVKPTPPIDSIGFTIQNNGINIYANTHDPNNNTHYYRWDYKETWQFHAEYQSSYVTDGKELVVRSPEQQIYFCFANSTSNSIALGSSAKLKQDVIYQSPIAQVASSSEKLENRYSILVNQYALTKEAFDFWQNLQKNTEQLGSIFDPQPSNINGNIHCTTNPAEPVIGYISVCNVQQKRIFIGNSQLPTAWQATYPYQCELDSLLFCRIISQRCFDEVQDRLIPIGSNELPITTIDAKGTTTVIGYVGAAIECADCRIRGTTTQPDFWK